MEKETLVKVKAPTPNRQLNVEGVTWYFDDNAECSMPYGVAETLSSYYSIIWEVVQTTIVEATSHDVEVVAPIIIEEVIEIPTEPVIIEGAIDSSLVEVLEKDVIPELPRAWDEVISDEVIHEEVVPEPTPELQEVTTKKSKKRD
jgi:hypothetical protein